MSVALRVNGNLIGGRSCVKMVYVCFAAARASLRVRIKHAGRFFDIRAFSNTHPRRQLTVESCTVALMTNSAS